MAGAVELVRRNRELGLTGAANAAGRQRAENLQAQGIQDAEQQQSRESALSGLATIGVGVATANPLAILAGSASVLGAGGLLGGLF